MRLDLQTHKKNILNTVIDVTGLFANIISLTEHIYVISASL